MTTGSTHSRTPAAPGPDRLRRALADPAHPCHLSVTGWVIAACIVLLALLPPLFLPLGPDEAIFAASGEKILQGAIHYRDIIDVKPPAIYYLYAAVVAIAGRSDFGLHLADLLLQGITCWLIIALLRRATGNDPAAALAAFWYAILYSGMRIGCEMQTESYCGLIVMPMLWLLLYRRRVSGFFLVGLLAGVLTMLKFTLGAILLPVIVCEWIDRRDQLPLLARGLMAIAAGFLAVMALFALYLVAFDATGGFFEVQQFINGYARVESASASRWAITFIESVPSYLLRHYSLLFLITLPLGIAAAFRSRPAGGPADGSRGVRYLLRFCAIAILIYFATVAMEGRYYVYHFSRLYPFAAILGTFGCAPLLRWLRDLAMRSGAMRVGAAIAIMILLLLSPINRYLWQLIPAGRAIAQGEISLDAIYDQWGSLYPRAELKEIGDMIRSRRKPGDHLFAASTFAGVAHILADDVPEFKIYHSAFIIAPFAPDAWRSATRNYLLERRPAFIIVQSNDPIRTLTGSDVTSEMALLALPGIDSLIRNDYRSIHRRGNFELYERIGR